MEKRQYKARKIKPENRESWVIEFRHPLLKDLKSGKYGKKVRRGLGTKDGIEADEYVSQMQEILDDKSYWEPAAKSKAILKFNDGIVNAFYDDLIFQIRNHLDVRESVISIKSLPTEYAKVSLLGATAAGKTTLVRQLMGTDPNEERFPATSTAKTTVFDTEIIFMEGSYKGVVSFYSENETRELIKESIRNAMVEFFLTQDEKQLLRVLLEDKDQRFRLGYVLGKIKTNKRNDESISQDDIDKRLEIETKLNNYIKIIIQITNEIANNTKLKYPTSGTSKEDIDILEEIICSEIDDFDDEPIQDLTDLIIEEIKDRFLQLEQSELKTEKFGWPIHWSIDTKDRESFMDKIKYFSGNSSQMFGKLLTPLVSGMRVSGPFKPLYIKNMPKLVLFDGEGLGHIPDTSSSIPSNVIAKFDKSTAIVLVDNAQNPMQAPPYALIKAVAISGHYKKLSICFTHFDLVKGDNIPELDDKIEHVFSSVDNVLDKLQKDLEYDVKKFLYNHFIHSTYYLSHLDENYHVIPNSEYDKDQITQLINTLEKSALPIEIKDMELTYQLYPFLYKIQNASKRFHSLWNGYLFGTPERSKAHFTQVKALSRRLGQGWANEYSYLKPISDFWNSFNAEISSCLQSPLKVIPSNVKDEDRLNKIDIIKRGVATKFESYAIDKIKNSEISKWLEAYEQSGYHSSFVRADKIKSIYDETVPIPEQDISKNTDNFVQDILKIVSETIAENGGKMETILK